MTARSRSRLGCWTSGAPAWRITVCCLVTASVEGSGAIRSPAFAQTETATLQVGLAGRTPQARAGSLTVTGPETVLAGTLAVTADPAFAVTLPQRLLLVATPGGPASGSFETVTGIDALPGGATAEVSSVTEGVALDVSPGG